MSRRLNLGRHGKFKSSTRDESSQQQIPQSHSPSCPLARPVVLLSGIVSEDDSANNIGRCSISFDSDDLSGTQPSPLATAAAGTQQETLSSFGSRGGVSFPVSSLNSCAITSSHNNNISKNATFKNKPGDVVYDHELTESDILSGKGRGVAATEGNQFFNRLIKMNQEEYQSQTGPSEKKKEITRQVFDIIKQQDPVGRFLTMDIGKGSDGLGTTTIWIVQNDKFAKKKIVQALREKPKKSKSQVKEGIDSKKNDSVDPNRRSSLKTTRSNFFRSYRQKSTTSTINLDNSMTPHPPSPVKRCDHSSQRASKKSSIISEESRRKLLKWMGSVSKIFVKSGSLHCDLGDDEIADIVLNDVPPSPTKAAPTTELCDRRNTTERKNIHPFKKMPTLRSLLYRMSVQSIEEDAEFIAIGDSEPDGVKGGMMKLASNNSEENLKIGSLSSNSFQIQDDMAMKSVCDEAELKCDMMAMSEHEEKLSHNLDKLGSKKNIEVTFVPRTLQYPTNMLNDSVRTFDGGIIGNEQVLGEACELKDDSVKHGMAKLSSAR